MGDEETKIGNVEGDVNAGNGGETPTEPSEPTDAPDGGEDAGSETEGE